MVLQGKDAWLNQGDTSRVGQLAANFNRLDADQRDNLIDDLNRLGKGSEALVERSQSLLGEDYQDLLNRTNAMSKSDDIDDLLKLEAELPEDHKERFWQAADISGDGIDTFVQRLEEVEFRERQVLIEYIARLADWVNQEELERDAAARLAMEAVEFIRE
mgnify:CR=1 FL=1